MFTVRNIDFSIANTYFIDVGFPANILKELNMVDAPETIPTAPEPVATPAEVPAVPVETKPDAPTES